MTNSITSASGRDTILDTIRGGAIISMTVAHLAGGSSLHRVTHLPLWMDGAIIFVLMSGLVLGIVQRRASERHGRPSFTKLFRRALFLYVLQLIIIGVAVLARHVTGRPWFAPSPDAHDGWGGLAFYAATLQLPAPNLTILAMYVVLLLAAVPIAWLCAQGRWWVAGASLVAIWLVGTLTPSLTVMPHIQEVGVARFNWATWLLPFGVAMIVGWFWKQFDLQRRLRSPFVGSGAIVLFVAFFISAHLFGRRELGGSAGAVVASAFNKWDLSIPTVLYGVSAIVAAYAVLNVVGALPVVRILTRWLTLIGSYSLDCFVILCFGVVLFPVVADYAKASTAGMVIAVGCLAVQTLWAWLRRRNAIPFAKKSSAIASREPTLMNSSTSLRT